MGDQDREVQKIPDEFIMAYVGERAFDTPGVYGMGVSLTASALTKNWLGQDKKTRGVKVSYDEDQGYIIDLFLLVAFGVNIPETAWNVQKNVNDGLKTDLNLTAGEINIHIQGVKAE